MDNRDYYKALRQIAESMEWQVVKPRLVGRLRSLRRAIRTTNDPIQQNRLIGEAGTLSDLIDEVENAKGREALYAEADSKQPVGEVGFG
jgi:hypothetical protein